MELRKFISAAGLDPTNTPTAAEIPVRIFDGNHCELTTPPVYANGLFGQNPQARDSFENMLKYLDANPPAELKVTIIANLVSVTGTADNTEPGSFPTRYGSFPRTNREDHLMAIS